MSEGLKANPIFAEIEAPIGMLLLSKHLAGKHDQSSHAGGRGKSNAASIGSLVGKSATSPVNLSERETEALSAYVNSWMHAEVNSYLRDGEKWLAPHELERAKAMDKDLSEAISRSELLQDTELVRGINIQSFPDDIMGMAGKTYVDKGFMSTTKSVYENDAFTGGVKINILAPKGTKALDVTQVFNTRLSSFDQEVLLQKGMKYKVTNVTSLLDTNEPYMYEMDVEIVK